MTEDAESAPVEVASPACYLHEADAGYMGYLSRTELGAIARKAARDVAAALDAITADDVSCDLRRSVDALDAWCTRNAALSGPSLLAGAVEPAAPRALLGRAAASLAASLPRIADDVDHREMKRIVGQLQAAIAQLDSDADEAACRP